MAREFRRRHAAPAGWLRSLLGPVAQPQGSGVSVACGDLAALPFPSGVFDLVWSNLALQWCVDPAAVFAEFLRVMRLGGLLMFSTLGPDTLKELRAAWSAADGHTHVSRFPDMHDLGDALVRTRFADPVMDAERLTVTYPRLSDLMADLKSVGAHNATDRRPRGLTGPRRLAALEAAYEAYRRDGRLPASYEVVYGHAWAPEQKPVADGVAIPLDAIREALGHPRRQTAVPGPRQTPRGA
jgi:malonyl-CoA O-methyltransferase